MMWFLLGTLALVIIWVVIVFATAYELWGKDEPCECSDDTQYDLYELEDLERRLKDN